MGAEVVDGAAPFVLFNIADADGLRNYLQSKANCGAPRRHLQMAWTRGTRGGGAPGVARAGGGDRRVGKAWRTPMIIDVLTRPTRRVPVRIGIRVWCAAHLHDVVDSAPPGRDAGVVDQVPPGRTAIGAPPVVTAGADAGRGPTRQRAGAPPDRTVARCFYRAHQCRLGVAGVSDALAHAVGSTSTPFPTRCPERPTSTSGSSSARTQRCGQHL